MTVDEKINYTLKEAFPSLKLMKDDFLLIGSAALILSGIKIENIYDLDISVSERDADFLMVEWRNRLIIEHVTKDNELFSSKFARYKFSELDIEIMGELKVNKMGVWDKLEISDIQSLIIENFEIKTPTLKEQKRILQIFGRKKDKDRLKLIDKKLSDSYVF